MKNYGAGPANRDEAQFFILTSRLCPTSEAPESNPIVPIRHKRRIAVGPSIENALLSCLLDAQLAHSLRRSVVNPRDIEFDPQ